MEASSNKQIIQQSKEVQQAKITSKSLSDLEENKLVLFVESISDIELVTGFPIANSTLERYILTLDRLKPNLTGEWLRVIIDAYLVGKIEWDNNNGIRNIFKAMTIIPKPHKH